MAQNDIQITTTPPLAGLTLVQGINGALQSLATDFAGSIDPAAIGGVGPYCTWADTGNGLLKRRNAAGTDWVVEGQLFKESAVVDDLIWRSKAIGEPFALLDNLAGVSAPDNSGSAKYIKLTAADPYNTGLLTSESVSGSAPLVLATAVISLADSPLNGLTVNLWNTERRIPRAGAAGTLENDATQDHQHGPGTPGRFFNMRANISGAAPTYNSGQPVSDDLFDTVTGLMATGRADSETRMKNQGVTYYMRIK